MTDQSRVGMIYGTLPIPPNPKVLVIHLGDAGIIVPVSYPDWQVRTLDLKPLLAPKAITVPDTETYDAIILHDVLDPLHKYLKRTEVRALLRTLSSVLRPDGVFCWSVNNRYDRENPRAWLQKERPIGGFIWHRNTARLIGLTDIGTLLVLPDLRQPEAMISPSRGAGAYYGRLYVWGRKP
jgi:SAM-dependent methyltransferase